MWWNSPILASRVDIISNQRINRIIATEIKFLYNAPVLGISKGYVYYVMVSLFTNTQITYCNSPIVIPNILKVSPGNDVKLIHCWIWTTRTPQNSHRSACIQGIMVKLWPSFCFRACG